MRSVTNHFSIARVGSYARVWPGAVNPVPPDFPSGTMNLSLQNVVVGSAIRIETQAGEAVLDGVADSTTEVIPVPVYVLGSPLNNLRIKVRKGSASPYYQPWETLATAVVGSQSIYVSQIPDE